MNVIYASDENFVPIMMTSILSLLVNNTMEEVSIYIIDNGINDKSFMAIENMCNQYKANIIRIEANNIFSEIDGDLHQERGSLSTFSRLFVASLLPENVERILYLDCDTVVCDSLKDLWETELSGKCVGVVKDAFSNWHKKNISCPKNESMFNAGVLLIDLRQWRLHHIEEKLKKILTANDGKLPYADQGALNCVLRGNVHYLHPQYNAMTLLFDLSYDEILSYRRVKNYYSRQEINKAISTPKIIHYVTIFSSVRPWFNNSDCKNLDKFDEYYKRVKEWFPTKKTDYKKSSKQRMLNYLYSILPRKCSVYILGILHSFVLPIWQRVKFGKVEI